MAIMQSLSIFQSLALRLWRIGRIADQLFIGESTLKTHRLAILPSLYPHSLDPPPSLSMRSLSSIGISQNDPEEGRFITKAAARRTSELRL